MNLSQRLQQLADAGETVLSSATMEVLGLQVEAEALAPQVVKGRETPVQAYKVGRQA